MKLLLSVLILCLSLPSLSKLPTNLKEARSDQTEKLSYILCRDAADGVLVIEKGPCPNGLPPIPVKAEKNGESQIDVVEYYYPEEEESTSH